MLEWRIYYGDGTTYSSTDGPPESAPCRNVQLIAQLNDEVGTQFCRDNDFYIYDPAIGGWQGVDIFGLIDYLFEPGFKIVKFGRTIGNADYRAALTRAMDDHEFPHKSAWYPTERRP